MDQKLDCITVIEKTSWLKRRFQLMIVFAAKFTMGLHLDKKKRTEKITLFTKQTIQISS